MTTYKSLRALFRAHKRWSTRYFGKHSKLGPLYPTHPRFNQCTSFCLIGGLCLVRKINSDDARCILDKFTLKEFGQYAAYWNNFRATHADILKFVRKYKL